MVSFASFMRNPPKWESIDQEKGMKALMQRLQKMGKLTDLNSVWAAIAWLIQKDHESAEWFIKLTGDHATRLENEIKKLQEENAKLVAFMDSFASTPKAELKAAPAHPEPKASSKNDSKKAEPASK